MQEQKTTMEEKQIEVQQAGAKLNLKSTEQIKAKTLKEPPMECD